MQFNNLEKIKQNISNNLIKFRNKQGLAQEILAFEAEVDRSLLSKYERCIGNPSILTLCKLANVLNVSVIELLADHQEKTAE
jgi:transcriptional regulator with XRE-family HTH domain